MNIEHLAQLQHLFLFIVLSVLGYLFVNGLVTKSVWLRGARSGWSLNEWAHKRSREHEPRTYFLAMTFYGLAFLWLAFLWAKGDAF